MSRKGLWIAAAVVIACNAFTLTRAGLNRNGEPEAVLDLTERELRLAPRETDNTAIVLRLEWSGLEPNNAANPVPDWFDAAKLASLGFDCRLPATAENAAHYRGAAPRSVYAALENDGDAWRRYLDGLASQQERDAASRRPRLVLVDVGTDASALRARYPDRRRTVIVPATAGLSLVQPLSGKPFLRGRINVVYPFELNVPKELRSVLEPIRPRAVSMADRQSGQMNAVGEPRYRVSVKWGRSLEPWIAAVAPMK
jgi:hypothetical protein